MTLSASLSCQRGGSRASGTIPARRSCSEKSTEFLRVALLVAQRRDKMLANVMTTQLRVRHWIGFVVRLERGNHRVGERLPARHGNSPLANRELDRIR